MSERELRPEDVPALFGRTPEAEPEQPAEPEAESVDADDQEQAQPASPDQAHNALLSELLSAPKADREFIERVHGLRRDVELEDGADWLWPGLGR